MRGPDRGGAARSRRGEAGSARAAAPGGLSDATTFTLAEGLSLEPLHELFRAPATVKAATTITPIAQRVFSRMASRLAKITRTLATLRLAAAMMIQRPMPKKLTNDGQPMRLIKVLSPVLGRTCRIA